MITNVVHCLVFTPNVMYFIIRCDRVSVTSVRTNLDQRDLHAQACLIQLLCVTGSEPSCEERFLGIKEKCNIYLTDRNDSWLLGKNYWFSLYLNESTNFQSMQFNYLSTFFLFLIYMMLGSQLEEKQVGLFPFVRLFFYVAFSQLSTSYKPPQPILPSLASISRAHLMPPTAASYVTVWWLRSLLGSAALNSLLAWERNEEYDCASACPPASSLGVGAAAVI